MKSFPSPVLTLLLIFIFILSLLLSILFFTCRNLFIDYPKEILGMMGIVLTILGITTKQAVDECKEMVRQEQQNLVKKELAPDIIRIEKNMLKALNALSRLPNSDEIENTKEAIKSEARMFDSIIEDFTFRQEVISQLNTDEKRERLSQKITETLVYNNERFKESSKELDNNILHIITWLYFSLENNESVDIREEDKNLMCSTANHDFPHEEIRDFLLELIHPSKSIALEIKRHLIVLIEKLKNLN